MWLFLLLPACVSTDPEPVPVRTVQVVRGDTLGELAKANGVTVAELKAWNGLRSDLIEVGQVLRVEAGDGVVATTPTPPRPRRSGRRSRTEPADQPPTDGPLEPEGPTVPSLRMPRAKKCLAGPGMGDVQGDEGMAMSQGLTQQGTSRAMNAFLPEVGSCLVGLDPMPAGPLNLEITVGCDGLVRSVAIRGNSSWPSANADCLRAALKYAEFPAHARPDGDSFLFPLQMQ